MLARTITMALCTVALSHAIADSLERQLIGTWLEENSSAPQAWTCYYTFRRDHTLRRRYRNGDRIQPSTWRVRGDRLIEHWWAAGMEHIDVCRPIIRGDTLSFGVHETRIRERGGTWNRGRAAFPSIYRRCATPKASNQAMQRTAGRSAFLLEMTSTFNLQQHTLSPAVADLVSR
jgi:hypothetical protein